MTDDQERIREALGTLGFQVRGTGELKANGRVTFRTVGDRWQIQIDLTNKRGAVTCEALVLAVHPSSTPCKFPLAPQLIEIWTGPHEPRPRRAAMEKANAELRKEAKGLGSK